MAITQLKRKRHGHESLSKHERLPRRLKLALNSTISSSKLPIKAPKEGWTSHPDEKLSENIRILASTDHQADEIDDYENDDQEHEQSGPVQTESPWNQINIAKEELSRIAAQIVGNPEDNLSSLNLILQIAKSDNPKVLQFALATQCHIFKDIIPGYSIRPNAADEAKDLISREVKQLRCFEQVLLASYRAYLNELGRIAKSTNQTQDWIGLRSTSITCASSLLLAVPHFNFRLDLLKLVINPLTRNTVGTDYEKSCQTIRTLFREDDTGRASLEAVQILAKSMRTKDYQTHPSLLDLFLHLRLLSEFSSKASYDRVDRTCRSSQTSKKMQSVISKKQHVSKRNRKLAKEQKSIEKEMKEADAIVGFEERDKLQAEMLKIVFATYFRILKDEVSHLMGSVLEGLARYAHLINQDFFGDILEALKDLIRRSEKSRHLIDDDDENDNNGSDTEIRDPTRESLLCAITAFALLQGQHGKAATTHLHLDLNFFVSNLFQLLLPTSLDTDIELGPKSLRLDDPIIDSTPRVKVNAKTKSVLLIRCLSSTLLPPSSLRSVPPLRIAAFTKHLMTSALQLPEKSCQALLGFLAQVSKVHSSSVAPLWNTEERKGDGIFDPLNENIEGSNPCAATIWEGELLRLHYSPKVTEAFQILYKNFV